MERTAEILDTATGLYCLTGEGATFTGRAECERRLFDLKRLCFWADGKESRFVVDWKDEGGNILDTFGLDEAGFEELTGHAPKTPDEYAAYDRAFWAAQVAAIRVEGARRREDEREPVHPRGDGFSEGLPSADAGVRQGAGCGQA